MSCIFILYNQSKAVFSCELLTLINHWQSRVVKWVKLSFCVIPCMSDHCDQWEDGASLLSTPCMLSPVLVYCLYCLWKIMMNLWGYGIKTGFWFVFLTEQSIHCSPSETCISVWPSRLWKVAILLRIERYWCKGDNCWKIIRVDMI